MDKDPLFNGTNYLFWTIGMETYMHSLGFDIQQSIQNGYTNPNNRPKGVALKRLKRNNAKEMNAIPIGLLDSKKIKVEQCKSAKYIWDKLQNIYTKENEDDKN